ncbi:thioredoxin [Zhengella sp. ZM62]|uniref:thioredoxin n=1 Tax=Zhengella sedimenti TaxID=3390035 RepID=UPI003976D446
MTNGNNPYQTGQTGYDTTMTFGDAGTGKAGSGDLIKDTTTAGFRADVIEESRKQPVLVDFWAPWCGPCRQLGPAIEKVVREARGKVKLVKMNIDEHPQIAGQLGVQSIPAVFAFVNGQPVDGFMGALPETQIRQFIEKLAGPADDGLTEALEAAQKARDEGDNPSALQIYGAILQQDPENADVLGHAATVLYEMGDKDQANQILDRVPAGKQEAETVKALKARMALDAEVGSLGDPMELARRLADNPDDHEARMDLAKIENARGDRQKAAEHLLAIIKADRNWNEDAARNQLLTFFEAWGMSDPATLSARRRLSSLLFS